LPAFCCPELNYTFNMRSALWLVIGVLAVFGAHVALPYLYISGCRSGALPELLCSLTGGIDPAYWMIFGPFALAYVGYNFVFYRCGISWLANRRLVRWPIAFVAAFLSHWAEMVLILNTFGS
jgi:hypothetical protein